MAASRAPQLHRTLSLVTRPYTPLLRLSNARALSIDLQSLERPRAAYRGSDSLSIHSAPCTWACSKPIILRVPNETVPGVLTRSSSRQHSTRSYSAFSRCRPVLSAKVPPPHPDGEKKSLESAKSAGGPSTQPSTSSPVSRGLDVAKERTNELRHAVRASLGNLTPRENIYNLPNFLTVTRLVAAPTTAYLLLHDQHTWALALFAYAGITDLVDGWMARKWKLQTVAGSVIDPMADKALMIILTVTLAVKGAIPMYLATLILGRDASLAIAAIYYRYASLPAPKTLLRYWDFSLPSAEVHPTTVSKYNTFLQLVLIGSTLALPVVTAGAHNAEMLAAVGLDAARLHLVMTYFQYLVAATTVWSGLSYAFLKEAVTIIGQDEALKAKQGARGRAIIGVTFGSLVLLAAWYAAEDLDDDTVEMSEGAASKESHKS